MNRGFQLNLVSLADIVSNAIGMLVLFALITVLNNRPPDAMPGEPPIEYVTRRSPMFFLCQGDAILYLDPLLLGGALLPAVDAALARRSALPGAARLAAAAPPSLPAIEIPKLGLAVKLDANLLIHLAPYTTSMWENSAALDNPKSYVRHALDRIDPARQFAYFFAADKPNPQSHGGSGFAVMEKASALLHARGVETGWQPYDEANLPTLCNFFDHGTCRHRPSQGPRRPTPGGPHGR